VKGKIGAIVPQWPSGESGSLLNGWLRQSVSVHGKFVFIHWFVCSLSMGYDLGAMGMASAQIANEWLSAEIS
jgi:hypothetical protein